MLPPVLPPFTSALSLLYALDFKLTHESTTSVFHDFLTTVQTTDDP